MGRRHDVYRLCLRLNERPYWRQYPAMMTRYKGPVISYTAPPGVWTTESTDLLPRIKRAIGLIYNDEISVATSGRNGSIQIGPKPVPGAAVETCHTTPLGWKSPQPTECNNFTILVVKNYHIVNEKWDIYFWSSSLEVLGLTAFDLIPLVSCISPYVSVAAVSS